MSKATFPREELVAQLKTSYDLFRSRNDPGDKLIVFRRACCTHGNAADEAKFEARVFSMFVISVIVESVPKEKY